MDEPIMHGILSDFAPSSRFEEDNSVAYTALSL